MVLQKLFIIRISSFLLLIILSSCGTEPDDKGENEINPNIKKLIDCCDRNAGNYFEGDYIMGVKNNERSIYASNRTLVEISIDEEFNLMDVELNDLIERGKGKPINYFHFDSKLVKGLLVRSTFPDVSLGGVHEIDFKAQNLTTLKDSSYNISSAIYWHEDDSKLVYYSYGNDDGLEAGYYLHNKTAETDSLLLAHRSPFGPSEMLNGFDLSQDNTSLLIPNVRASQDEFLTPQIIEFDLTTGLADTLDVEFDFSSNRIGLWLRYSPDGTQILYSNFPTGSFTETTNDDSEMGIIDRQTGERRVLDANTNSTGSLQSVQLAPTWSPDGNHIIYGSAPVFFPSGAKGSYSLYVLKNVHDSRNYN